MSPQIEIERLTKESGESQVKAAISSCIANEIRAGRDREQAIAMCHEMARRQGANVPAPREES